MMDKDKLNEIIESHGRWLRDEGGERADLQGADLRGADLRGANLCEANLFGANLCKTDLRGANLCEANLCGANLCEANLCGADLRGANLRGANLREADLCEADLPEKIIQVGPIGSREDYTIYWVDRDIVQCGCWKDYKGGSIEEFKKCIDDVYPDGQYRQEYLAAIAMFEKMRESKDGTCKKDEEAD